MNRKTLFALLACALLGLSMLGCGTTRHLQSIQISSSTTDESTTGTISIGINGAVVGPVQLYTWGNYSNGESVILYGTGLAYQIELDPTNNQGVESPSGQFYTLDEPPLTLELSSTGLLTAVDPSACSWNNSAAGTSSTTAAWEMVGSYVVTSTYKGLTSPPVYVAIASAPGIYDAKNNDSGHCGPTK